MSDAYTEGRRELVALFAARIRRALADLTEVQAGLIADVLLNVPIGENCPGCDEPAQLLLDQQAFCGTAGCPVFDWDPAMTLADLAASVSFVDLGRGEGRRERIVVEELPGEGGEGTSS